MRVRCTSIYGSAPTQQGSIPVPSRAIDHEVAIAVMQALYLEFEIRLTGLYGAAHLNSNEGVIHDDDLTNHE